MAIGLNALHPVEVVYFGNAGNIAVSVIHGRRSAVSIMAPDKTGIARGVGFLPHAGKDDADVVDVFVLVHVVFPMVVPQ